MKYTKQKVSTHMGKGDSSSAFLFKRVSEDSKRSWFKSRSVIFSTAWMDASWIDMLFSILSKGNRSLVLDAFFLETSTIGDLASPWSSLATSIDLNDAVSADINEVN